MMAATAQSSTFKRPFYNMDNNSGVSLYRDLKLKRRRILDLVGCDTDSCVSNESRRSMGSESSGYVSDCDQFSDASVESSNSPHNVMPIMDDSTKPKSVDVPPSTISADKASDFAEKQRFEEFAMKVKVEAAHNGTGSSNNNNNSSSNNSNNDNNNNNNINVNKNVKYSSSMTCNNHNSSDIDNTNSNIGGNNNNNNNSNNNNNNTPVNMPFGVAYVGFPPGFVWHPQIIGDQTMTENMTTVNMIPVMTTVATPTVHTMPALLNTNSNGKNGVTEMSHINFVLKQPHQMSDDCHQASNTQPQSQGQQIAVANPPANASNQTLISRPGTYQLCQYPYVNHSNKEFEQRVSEAKKPWVVTTAGNQPNYMCMTTVTTTCGNSATNGSENPRSGTANNNTGNSHANVSSNHQHHHHHHHFHNSNNFTNNSHHPHHLSNNGSSSSNNNSNNANSINSNTNNSYYPNSVPLNKELEVCCVDDEPMLENGAKGMDADSDNEEIMICAICNDRATGLHYGIITCEGCKGFFKRTVQNKRVYTCVASGNCEINKMQRNRCQYCRFKKCLQMGMVLAAVREDRMPGGRNSGAVYNLYKVKYKKHKRKKQVAKLYKQKVAQISVDHDMNIKTEPVDIKSQMKIPLESPSSVMNPRRTTIVTQYNPVAAFSHQQQQQQQRLQLPTAQHVPQQDNQLHHCQGDMKGAQFQYQTDHSKLMGSQPQPGKPPPTQSQVPPTQLLSLMPVATMPQFERLINELIQCDCLLDIADACKLDELVNDDIVSNTLYKIGDNIVNKLVKWTRQLPFYSEIPLQIHQQILTEKWHELLLLITTAHRALVNTGRASMSFGELYRWNMSKLAQYLNKNFEKYFTLEELTNEIGEIVEKITHVMAAFMNMNLSKQEYVCLQVVLLLNHNQTMPVKEVERVQERYTNALQQYIAVHHPDEPNRFGELLLRLPEIQSASALLLKSKMIYVPFLLTS